MRAPGAPRILQGACACGLAALAMMAWSLFDPRPLPVVAAMSIGQLLGTLSFLSFLYVVATDLRRARQATPAKTDPGAPRAG